MEDTAQLSENIIQTNENNAIEVVNEPKEVNKKDENDPLYPERSELNEKKHLQITLLRIEKELNDSKKKKINSIYKKYIINEELTNRRIRKTLSRSFLCCAFQIFLPIIEIINLIGIFIVISIMNTMFTLLWNSIKSYSLFNLGGQYNLNFYKELYNDSMNQTIDFNIMFFMNFLGEMMLKSKGFVFSSFLFLIINWLCFFWVYNFTFKDNKNPDELENGEIPQEPETYTFFNILFILGFFLLLFIGVGGSSMLSQQILLDSYEKLNIYSQKKSKKEKASKERKEKMKKLEEENKTNECEYKELLKEEKKAEEEEEDSDIEEESDENAEEKEEEEEEDDDEELPKISIKKEEDKDKEKEEDKDKEKKEEIIPVKEPEEENNNIIITNDIKNEKDNIEKKLESIEEVGQELKEKDDDKDKKEGDKKDDDAKLLKIIKNN